MLLRSKRDHNVDTDSFAVQVMIWSDGEKSLVGGQDTRSSPDGQAGCGYFFFRFGRTM